MSSISGTLCVRSQGCSSASAEHDPDDGAIVLWTRKPTASDPAFLARIGADDPSNADVRYILTLPDRLLRATEPTMLRTDTSFPNAPLSEAVSRGPPTSPDATPPIPLPRTRAPRRAKVVAHSFDQHAASQRSRPPFVRGLRSTQH